MATINSRGQLIPELSIDDPEDREYLSIAKKLRQLYYPKDEETLTHLSYRHFCQWLYGLDPKLALYLTNSPKFRILQQAVKNKSMFRKLLDRYWRFLNGFDF